MARCPAPRHLVPLTRETHELGLDPRPQQRVEILLGRMGLASRIRDEAGDRELTFPTDGISKPYRKVAGIR